MIMEVINYTGQVGFLRPIADAWQKEANADRFGLNTKWSKFRATLQEFADSQTNALFILSDNGLPVGFMCAMQFESPLDGQQMMRERFWFVLPRHRGRNALKLRTAFKEWARGRGASHILMSASMLASDKHDRICRLYEKSMKLFETTYICKI